MQQLNNKQQEAVLTTEGPLLILAGAGSGKTRVLTNRIAYLIGEKQVPPYHILAITFTNKAAREMRERVDKIVGSGGEQVWVATFHSTCVRILRRHADRLGYTSDFSIYDTDDTKTLIKNIMKSMNADTKVLKEKNVMRVISSCKDRLKTPEDYMAEAADFREKQIAKIFAEYEIQMHRNNAMDFDDLIVNTVKLFEGHPDVLDSWQERFRYIMVDEYQDTNYAQFRFVELLARKYHNICVVGDDDQSIYKFRGADIENILSFEKAFAGAKVIKLEENYRSTGNILDAANAVIAHNRGRKSKTLWTGREAGRPVRLFQYENANDEADAVIRDIRGLAESGNYDDFAVLYRTNAQSRLLEERCVTLGIPYQLIGGINFYERKEIKDVLAYLKTIQNGRDDVAVRRIINVPKRGIGAATVGKIDAAARDAGICFLEACREAGNPKVDRFVALIDDYKNSEKTAAELIDSILYDTGYYEELQEEGEVEAQTRVENIEELKSKATDYDNLREFLEEVALVADVDTLEDDAKKVTLMTLHGAKGLEFPQVYMTGMEEGLFPGMQTIHSDDRSEMEEERRICYVGITRAKDRLTLTFARARMVNGETRWSKASRFVEEIPEDYLEKHVLERNYYMSSSTEEGMERDTERVVRSFRRQPKNDAFRKPVSLVKGSQVVKADHLDYGVGDRVRHIKFGEGTVKEVKEGARDFEVTVEFDTAGPRNLLAGFAKLEKVE